MDSKAKTPPSKDEAPPAFVVDENLTLEQWIKDKQEYKNADWGPVVSPEELERNRLALANAVIDVSRARRLK